MDKLIILEVFLFSFAALAFGIREIVMLSPKNIAKSEAKEAVRREKYAREEAELKARRAGHAEG